MIKIDEHRAYVYSKFWLHGLRMALEMLYLSYLFPGFSQDDNFITTGLQKSVSPRKLK